MIDTLDTLFLCLHLRRFLFCPARPCFFSTMTSVVQTNTNRRGCTHDHVYLLSRCFIKSHGLEYIIAHEILYVYNVFHHLTFRDTCMGSQWYHHLTVCTRNFHLAVDLISTISMYPAVIMYSLPLLALVHVTKITSLVCHLCSKNSLNILSFQSKASCNIRRLMKYISFSGIL